MIENKRDYVKALDIINVNITNIQEKVQCLQQYVPKLLKTKIDSNFKLEEKEKYDAIVQKQNQQKKILDIVKEIAWGLVDYQKHKQSFKQFDKFTLKSH